VSTRHAHCSCAMVKSLYFGKKKVHCGVTSADFIYHLRNGLSGMSSGRGRENGKSKIPKRS
jgi:hypothetical protein